jgi:hypothetical protein
MYKVSGSGISLVSTRSGSTNVMWMLVSFKHNARKNRNQDRVPKKSENLKRTKLVPFSSSQKKN